MASATITVGVQAGDVASSEATEPYFLRLRQLLKRDCIGPYSRDIEEFAIVIRLCGDLWHFEGEGPERFRISRKSKYITADIVVPRSRWEGVDVAGIKSFFASSVRETIQMMADKLIRAKIEVDASRLLADLDKALATFGEEVSPIK